MMTNNFYITTKSDLRKRWQTCFYGILTFFLIFAFPVLPFLSSAKLVLLFVVLDLLLLKDLNLRLNNFSFRFKSFPKIYYLLFLYTVAVTVIACAFDMSLASKVFSGFFLYIISFWFFSRASLFLDIDKAIVYCFFIQSVFIILAIFSESFFSFTARFRAEMSIGHELAYGRLRGNAVCGYQFFGIASMFSFVTIYLLLHWEKFKYAILIFVPVFFASVCSGRFSIVGIFIGVGMLIIKAAINGKIGRIIWICMAGILLLIVAVVLLYNNVDNITDPVMYNVVQHYLMDPIDSILFEGSFHASSTDRMLEMYGQDDIKQYFWLGAGRYINPDGHYFGGIDIGYYRMLGYYGVVGFILLFYVLYYLIYRTRTDLDIYTKHAFFINFLVLNMKGDIEVFNNNIIPIVTAFLFFSRENKVTCLFDKK